MMRAVVVVVPTVLLLALLQVPGCRGDSKPNVAGVNDFLDAYNTNLEVKLRAATKAEWAFNLDMNAGTADAMAMADDDLWTYLAGQIKQAFAFMQDDLTGVDPAQVRRLHRMRTSQAVPPTEDTKLAQSLSDLMSAMETMYGADNVLADAEVTLRTSRNAEKLSHAWKTWHAHMSRARPLYMQYVEQMNQAAKGIGFGDAGQMWRGTYELPDKLLKAKIAALWNTMDPLYHDLHCYVRNHLAKHYPDEMAKHASTGLIPVHLTGNMWGQDWSNIADLVMPYPNEPSYDPTPALKKLGAGEPIVRKVEQFYTSLGLPSLPDSFWTKSMLTRDGHPRAQCHASAWNMFGNDVRLKACIEATYEDMLTVHHELGHIWYFMAYDKQANIDDREGGNAGFHEAVGDAMALSTTPDYLFKAGLLDKAPSKSHEAAINHLMRVALEKLPLLPFAKMVDEWRWSVFVGHVNPGRYNEHWWWLRESIGGIAPPVERSDSAGDFDAAGKFHVAASVPYLRYFFADVLQFQIHDHLCKLASDEHHAKELHAEPHWCTIYDSKDAGAALQALMSQGASKPWKELLHRFDGSNDLSAAAMHRYFAPLHKWLKKENAKHGAQCVWVTDNSAVATPHVTPRSRGGLIVSMLFVGLVMAGVAAYARHRVQNKAPVGEQKSAYEMLEKRGKDGDKADLLRTGDSDDETLERDLPDDAVGDDEEFTVYPPQSSVRD